VVTKTRITKAIHTILLSLSAEMLEADIEEEESERALLDEMSRYAMMEAMREEEEEEEEEEDEA